MNARRCVDHHPDKLDSGRLEEEWGRAGGGGGGGACSSVKLVMDDVYLLFTYGHNYTPPPTPKRSFKGGILFSRPCVRP